MPNDKYMDREVASVGGTIYRQRYLARKQAQEATVKETSQKVAVPRKQASKRGSKR